MLDPVLEVPSSVPSPAVTSRQIGQLAEAPGRGMDLSEAWRAVAVTASPPQVARAALDSVHSEAVHSEAVR